MKFNFVLDISNTVLQCGRVKMAPLTSIEVLVADGFTMHINSGNITHIEQSNDRPSIVTGNHCVARCIVDFNHATFHNMLWMVKNLLGKEFEECDNTVSRIVLQLSDDEYIHMLQHFVDTKYIGEFIPDYGNVYRDRIKLIFQNFDFYLNDRDHHVVVVEHEVPIDYNGTKLNEFIEEATSHMSDPLSPLFIIPSKNFNRWDLMNQIRDNCEKEETT